MSTLKRDAPEKSLPVMSRNGMVQVWLVPSMLSLCLSRLFFSVQADADADTPDETRPANVKRAKRKRKQATLMRARRHRSREMPGGDPHMAPESESESESSALGNVVAAYGSISLMRAW